MADSVTKKTYNLNDTWTFWYAPRGKKAKSTENYLDNFTALGSN